MAPEFSPFLCNMREDSFYWRVPLSRLWYASFPCKLCPSAWNRNNVMSFCFWEGELCVQVAATIACVKGRQPEPEIRIVVLWPYLLFKYNCHCIIVAMTVQAWEPRKVMREKVPVGNNWIQLEPPHWHLPRDLCQFRTGSSFPMILGGRQDLRRSRKHWGPTGDRLAHFLTDFSASLSCSYA